MSDYTHEEFADEIMKHWNYLKYVAAHKWYVFLEGRKLGVPYRRLIFHDWSKFLPKEWFAYANHFYGPKSPEKRPGYYNPFDTGDDAFDIAVASHVHRHDHHWQHWVKIKREEYPTALPMSNIARREMLADWRGASRAQGGSAEISSWWRENRLKMVLHIGTSTWIDWQIVRYTW